MALKTTTIFLLTLNILFFSLVSSEPAPVPLPACPINGFNFGSCIGLLNNNVVLGSPPTLPCCSIFLGIANLEAAACLCRAITANLLGANVEASASLSFVFNNCGQQVPSGIKC